MVKADRSEKRLLSVGFVIVGLCLLTIALRLNVSPSARVIDAVLGVASVVAGLFRLLKNRNRKGRRINF